jgi:hypothetical protein
VTTDATKFDVTKADGNALMLEAAKHAKEGSHLWTFIVEWVRDEAVRQAEARVRDKAVNSFDVNAGLNGQMPEWDGERLFTETGVMALLQRFGVVNASGDYLAPTPPSSSPVARAEVTEEVLEDIWNRRVRDVVGSEGCPWASYSYDGNERRARGFAEEIASLSSPDAAAVRKAFKAGAKWAWWSHSLYLTDVMEAADKAFDERYPLPAPPAAPRSVPPVGVCAICGGEVGNGHGEWREGANDTHEHLSTFDCIKALRSQVKSLASTLAGTK